MNQILIKTYELEKLLDELEKVTTAYDSDVKTAKKQLREMRNIFEGV